MSATAASADDFAQPTTAERKRFARLKKATRNVATKTRNGLKATGSFVVSGVKTLVRGVRRTVGYAGATVATVLKWAVATVTAVAAFLAVLINLLYAAVVALVLFVLTGIMTALSKGADYFLWLARDKSQAKVTLKAFMRERQIHRDMAWDDATDTVKSTFRESMTEDTVVGDKPDPWWANWRKQRDAENESLLVDVPMADEFPGATIQTLYDVDDETNTEFEDGMNVDLDSEITRAIGNSNPALFDFSPYYGSPHDLMQVYRFYSTHDEIEIRSYFRGRVDAYQCYLDHQDTGKWDRLYGRYWAILYQKLKNEQDKYSVKYLRAGFYAQIEELQKKVAV